MVPMPPRFPLGVILSLAVVVPAPWSNAAAAEKRKQEQKKPTPKPSSYTDEDLKAARRTGKGSFSRLEGQPSASPSPSPEASPSAEPDRALQEKRWRARFAEARARIAEAEARSYEERIEVVFVAGIPVQQKTRVKVETEELRQARKALDDLEEELRRSGGLPGWAR
jgi:hypothetical protein